MILYLTYLEVEIYDYSFTDGWIYFFSRHRDGTLNGLFEVILFNRLFRKMKFIYVVLNKTLFLLMAFFLTMIIYIFVHNYI